MRALCSILFKLDNALASPPHLWEADEEVLVRIHFIIAMIRCAGLAPWEFNFFFQVALHLPKEVRDFSTIPADSPKLEQPRRVSPRELAGCRPPWR